MRAPSAGTSMWRCRQRIGSDPFVVRWCRVPGRRARSAIRSPGRRAAGARGREDAPQCTPSIRRLRVSCCPAATGRKEVMIAIAWQFEVKPGHGKEFERFYGADGEWTAVNRHSRSYLGTSFLRDQTRPAFYMVIEYWS